MEFATFARLCRALEATRSRRQKTRLAAAFLRQLAPAEVPWAVAFLTGRPFPAADPRVLEVSGATLAAVEAASGPPPDAPALALLDVARAFETIAAAGGPGARSRREALLGDLLARATAEERAVLRRIVHGEMRLGLHEGLVPEAVAEAVGAPPALVRRALLFLADPAAVATLALAEGPGALATVGVRLFVPLAPMLAEPAADVAEALAAHGGRTALEFKYDGARVQVHKAGEVVRLWSRRLTEVTASLPDVVGLARRAVRANTAILDGEVVAVGPDDRPLPFQELMRRFRRVHGVEASAREVPLRLYVFDCLLLDDRSLIDEPCARRWDALVAHVAPECLAHRVVVGDLDAAQACYQDALARGYEGLIAKALESPYLPGSRGRRWLKVKPAQTLDCVIVAADRGSGRRRGWLSNYHLAVRDAAGRLVPVGKTFKGLTDEEFRTMTARLRALALADDGYTVTVRPEVVVEVAYAEIQRSPHYASGFALRFARITRIRDDRSPGDASTLEELRARFARQAAREPGRDRAGP